MVKARHLSMHQRSTIHSFQNIGGWGEGGGGGIIREIRKLNIHNTTSFSIWHLISTLVQYYPSWGLGLCADIMISGWYGVWYGNRYASFSINEYVSSVNSYLVKYQVATVPDTTNCWQAMMNSLVQIRPIRWYHHRYETLSCSVYFTKPVVLSTDAISVM